jgi:hypothetical protein
MKEWGWWSEDGRGERGYTRIVGVRSIPRKVARIFSPGFNVPLGESEAKVMKKPLGW